MKIIYLTDQMYLHGGVEKMVSQKINYFINYYGYEVFLCTSEQRNKDFIYPIVSKAHHFDLRVNYFRSKSYFHPLNLIKSVKHFVRLKYLINTIKPDIIISANNTPEQYFIPFLGNKIPTVKEFHSSGGTLKFDNSIFGKCKQQLFLLLNRYTTKVVLNPEEKQYYPFDGIEVIPNFIASNTSSPSLKQNTIIAAGRIAPVKQFEHLIEAWAKIVQDFPNWEVQIYGDGDEQLKQQLQNQIVQLQVPRIEFKGATQHLDLVMQRGSIYAMTSASECFPMVLLEAQAAGMAVISYDCPNGPRNIITHNKNGILVADQNIDLFAIELKQLIQNEPKQKKIQLNAQQNSTQFSEDTIMKKWDALFKSINT